MNMTAQRRGFQQDPCKQWFAEHYKRMWAQTDNLQKIVDLEGLLDSPEIEEPQHRT